MTSRNLTGISWAADHSTKSGSSWSFNPFMITVLILTLNPSALAVRIASITVESSSRRVIRKKLSRSRLSRLIFKNCNRVCLNRGKCGTSNKALVVSPSFFMGKAESPATISMKSLRNSGSPPVKRTSSIPNATRFRVTRVKSAALAQSFCGINTGCSGMQ